MCNSISLLDEIDNGRLAAKLRQLMSRSTIVDFDRTKVRSGKALMLAWLI